MEEFTNGRTYVSKTANMTYEFPMTLRGEKFLISVGTHNQNGQEVQGFCDALLFLRLTARQNKGPFEKKGYVANNENVLRGLGAKPESLPINP